MPPICASCNWFARDGNEENGQCRRHAPPALLFLIDDNPERFAAWPIVHQTDFCGEHQPLPVRPQQEVPK